MSACPPNSPPSPPPARRHSSTSISTKTGKTEPQILLRSQALTKCRGTRAALQLAEAWGYLSEVDSAEVDASLDQVAAMLWTLVHRPRRAA